MAKRNTWDSLKLSVIAGKHITTGFAQGSLIEIVPDSDVWTTTVDADGNSSRHKTNNNNFTVTITLAQSSPSNDVYSGFYNLDRLSNTGSFPMVIEDDNGTTLITSLGAYIERPADASMSIENTDRVWVIKMTDANYFVGGY